MSYEIVRDRRFIKVGEDKYIPLILSGSNNCTQINYETGREVLERDWHIFWGSKDIITTKEQMLDWAKHCIENHSVEYEAEWFKQGGKWVTGEMIFKWIENGCRDAYSIEDYRRLARVSLKCEIVISHSEDSATQWKNMWERKNRKYIETTEELLHWIEEFEAYVDEDEKANKYANIAFDRLEPLKIARPTQSAVLDKPYICKTGKQYLSDYSFGSRYSITYTPNMKDAKIFTDPDEFQLVQDVCARVHRPVQAVSAAVLDKKTPFAILAVKGFRAGTYIEKMTKKYIHFSLTLERAQKFATKKQAEAFFEKLKVRYSSWENLQIVNTEEGE